MDEDTNNDLYKKIEGLVRNHDHREPYLTNTIKRIYWLALDGLTPDQTDARADYRRGYSNGWIAGKKSAAADPASEHDASKQASSSRSSLAEGEE